MSGGGGLERSCGAGGSDWIRQWDAAGGVERFAARFTGVAYSRHRHDTYVIGITEAGAQAFDYRGVAEVSAPGEVFVLHPDEPHDGRAAGDDGFAYAQVYVEPARIAAAVRALRGRPAPLPFARAPVSRNATLAAAVRAAFAAPLEPLALDAVVLSLAEGLLAADASVAPAPPPRGNAAAVERARRFLDAECARVVRSAELEAAAGLTRYELARQFRLALGTSPYRYLTMRRLDRARGLLARGTALAEAALASGFADQAHFTRAFRAAFGLTPGRYARLAVSSR